MSFTLRLIFLLTAVMVLGAMQYVYCGFPWTGYEQTFLLLMGFAGFVLLSFSLLSTRRRPWPGFSALAFGAVLTGILWRMPVQGMLYEDMLLAFFAGAVLWSEWPRDPTVSIDDLKADAGR